jgi:hypothetical protein
MRRSLLVTGGLVGIAIAVALFWRHQRAPIIYSAGKGPADWITYSSSENGFELRYPADWWFSQYPSLISLSGPSNVTFSIYRIPLSLEVLRRESQHGRYLPQHASRHAAVVAGLSGEQWNYLTGNFVGSWSVETFVLPRGSRTYLVSWSAGGTSRKETPADRALCHAVLSTFRFIELRHADYLSYHDPSLRFSFEYPSDWQLSGGLVVEPAASLRRGEATWIGVYVIARTSLGEFKQQHSITEMTPKTEWFAHRLSGLRGRWNGRDAYIFERDADLVVINIFRTNESAEVMTHFFDSFTLGSYRNQ